MKKYLMSNFTREELQATYRMLFYVSAYIWLDDEPLMQKIIKKLEILLEEYNGWTRKH
jgi:hypothetical protein